jgi:TonB family protein
VRKLRFGALFLLALLFPGNTAAEVNLLAAGAAQGANGNPSEGPKLIVQDVCSPKWSRGNSGSALFLTILFPWSSIFGYNPFASVAALRGHYEDSPQGLANLLVDICAAKRAQNNAALDELFNGLMLPDYASWMVETFGEAMGRRMAVTYFEERGGMPAQFSSGFSKLMEGGAVNAEISSFGFPIRLKGKGTEPDILLETFRPTRIYFVRFYSADRTNTEDRAGLLFVYVRGGFRLFPTSRPAPAAPAETLAAPAPITEEPVGGVPGGVVGGVPGGVPGGVIGGVIGGVLDQSEPPPPPRNARVQSIRVIRVSGSVMQAKLLRRVEPVYPAIARQARISGVVILEVTVTRNGSIQTIRSLSGHPLLIHAASEAVSQWKYEPTMLNGEPVDVVTTVTVNFRLDTQPPE